MPIDQYYLRNFNLLALQILINLDVLFYEKNLLKNYNYLRIREFDFRISRTTFH